MFKKVLVLMVSGLACAAQELPPRPATSAETSAGLLHNVYIAPDTLAEVLAEQPTISASYTSNGLELNITNNLYLGTGLASQTLSGNTNARPYIQTLNAGANGSGTVIKLTTNSMMSSLSFLLTFETGTSMVVSTNQVQINFGQTFVNPPMVLLSLASPQGYAVNAGSTQLHFDHSTTTTTNAWACTGATGLANGSTNVYFVLVIGR